MIPFIKSLAELNAITESRDSDSMASHEDKFINFSVDSAQRKRYTRSIEKNNISLPDLPKNTMRKWITSKTSISKFIDELDYNNQIQSSYELTLLARQNKSAQQDVA